jgi:RNA polymerase sigma-70 factor (ECF subfamily)
MTEREVQVSALVELAQDGDEGAFRTLVELHQQDIFTLALRLVRNRELAHDVAQETFIKAWKALPRFRGDAKFSTWIHRICVNTAWTLRVRAKRHQHDDLDEERFGAGPRPAISPEQAGEAADLRGRLQRALDQLPVEQRTVVVMKDVYDWTHEEIAEAMDVTVSASKVRLHRAHRRLQRILITRDGLDD